MTAALADVHPGDVDDSPQGWRVYAACRGADPNLFFPPVRAGQSFQTATEGAVRRYCHRCPVTQACDDFAEQTRSVGLWAGRWRRYRGTSYIRSQVLPFDGAVS